ncbi:2-amino-4-hydroxy-6-hydroxymethyldihydropteridine diphosphokinase [Sandaracinobacteroides hominis]|uniref:2-amino-4-hydroxy-6- hydroxymethyldihydropteridine diphosphokinase n=1 Tax=Sandaracinobacteroides hominis TaxID=2780086 RepID=UPI0018F50003|nr:2-amino-4-hydroxy-6-hydroxymethyldihydropteridine diphosphokinase [Sandaracinobacteroides hominis]
MQRSATSPDRSTPVIVALGGNRCHGRHGRPEQVLQAAIRKLAKRGLRIERTSRILSTPPLGPSNRRYANSALKARWGGSAPELLSLLKALEREFGRRRGQRWGARVLDCDLIAFGQQSLHLHGLELPHPRLHQRDFVLRPMLEIWPDWRHPQRLQTVRQMLARLQKPKPSG